MGLELDSNNNLYPIAMSNAFLFHFQNLTHKDPKLLQPAPPAPSIPPTCRTSPLLHRRRGGITDLKASSTAPIAGVA